MQDDIDWYGPDAATFGDRLAAAREAAGMTPEALARRLGVRLRSLQAWENDMSEPRANRLSMLAGLLNVSIVWLLTGEGEGVGNPDEPGLSPDVGAVLLEMRALRSEMLASADKLSRLEKRLRKIVQEQAQQ
jgi:transcriptional regulator with XRE-family HTH domain